jgi:hypothetical protein
VLAITPVGPAADKVTIWRVPSKRDAAQATGPVPQCIDVSFGFIVDLNDYTAGERVGKLRMFETPEFKAYSISLFF